jgi:hypothetical protein
MEFDIRPGTGCGPLRFGDTREEVEAKVGRPDREDVEGREGETTIGWHYEKLELSCYFDEDAEFRLTVFEVDALEVSVHGLRPIGLSIAEAEQVFADHGGLLLDEELGDGRTAVCDLGECGVTLWFDEGDCDSVQVSVGVDDQDCYVWPAT